MWTAELRNGGQTDVGVNVVLGTTVGSVCPVASILNYMAYTRPAGSVSSGKKSEKITEV